MKRSTTVFLAACLAALLATCGCSPRYYHGPREKGTNYYPLITKGSPFGSVPDSQKYHIWVLNSSSFKDCYVNIQRSRFMRAQEFFNFAKGDTAVYPDLFSPDEDDLTVTIRFPCDDCVDSLGWHTITRQFPISGLAPPQRLLVLTDETLMWGEEKQPGQVTNTRVLDLLVHDQLNNWYTLHRLETRDYTETISGDDFWIEYMPANGKDRYGQPAIPVKEHLKIDKLRQHLRKGPDGKPRFYGWFIDIGRLPERWLPEPQSPQTTR